MIFFLPLGHTGEVYRRPWANIGLIAANTAIFALAWAGVGRAALASLLLDPADFSVIQLFTHAFLHTDLFHLLGNMIFLWVFGNAVNDRLGHARYLGAYAAFAVLAGLGYLVVDGSGPMLGASGAICGVVGMFLVLLAGTEIKVFYFVLFRAGFLSVNALILIGLWAIEDAVWMLLLHDASAVAYSAHVAGYCAGALAAVVLVKARWVEDSDDDLFHLLNPVRTRPTSRILSEEEVEPPPMYDPVKYDPRGKQRS